MGRTREGKEGAAAHATARERAVRYNKIEQQRIGAGRYERFGSEDYTIICGAEGEFTRELWRYNVASWFEVGVGV